MDLRELTSRLIRGGPQKYHQKNAQRGKLFVRERIETLCDPESSFIEEGRFANGLDEEFPCDGVITGWGVIHGKPIGVIANDSTVKAGSWGPLTVEKIIRLQEQALKRCTPIVYLVDSAGARLTDQVRMFPGRRGAGRIFYNQVQLKQKGVTQLCVVLGPCAAGGAYVPAFCDVVVMVKDNGSMYLGSPRMAEVVIGEQVSHDQMGGTDLHTTQSGCAHVSVETEQAGLNWLRAWMQLWTCRHTSVPFNSTEVSLSLKDLIPNEPSEGYDIHDVLKGLLDAGSFMEVHATYAPELVCGLGSVEGQVIGIVANQPAVKGGVIFCESAEKASLFIHYCDRQRIPILFLCDVPGFMIGSTVEKQGIIRRGAQMVEAVSSATVPKITLILRKAYGAGLYAMCGPAFEPDVCLALPSAQIAVMGPGPAVEAVHHHHLNALSEQSERESFVSEKKEAYLSDVNLLKLASELVVDHVIDFDEAKTELAKRFKLSMETFLST